MVLKVPALPSASHTQALLCTGPTYRCCLVPPCPKHPCFWGADRFGENERVTSSKVQRQIRPHHVSIPGSLLAQPPAGPPLSPAITPAAPHPAFLQPPIFMKGRPSMWDHEVWPQGSLLLKDLFFLPCYGIIIGPLLWPTKRRL